MIKLIFVAIVLAFCGIFVDSVLVYFLWNFVAPALHVPSLGFIQAAAVTFLFSILFNRRVKIQAKHKD